MTGSQNLSAANPSTTSAARATATIGNTIVIKGEVSGAENLIIEGTVEGSINLSSHEVAIGKSGMVNADINAKAIRIDGEVKGDLVGGDVVTIAKTGNVRGNIVAPRVTLEDGAKFKGSIDMDPGEASTAGATPAPAEKAQRVVSEKANRGSSISSVKNG